jgi:hypothetical protein
MDLSVCVPDERSRRELKGFLTNVLRDVAPGEVSRFDAIKDISDVAALARPSGAPSRRIRGIPSGIEVGVIFVHLVTGTLALIEGYRSRRERRERQESEYEIRQAWQQALIQAGMSAELAKLIPVKFSPDMIRFITALRFQESDSSK